jgi:hypothetical protein
MSETQTELRKLNAGRTLEYIISENLFKTLDEEDKKLWHSHHYEVKSGTLIAPGIPEVG